MLSKGQKKGTVRFTFKPSAAAKRVQLAGDFSGWRPVTMRRQKDSSFVAVVPLAAGSYEYKFIVDGHWMQDPDNSALAMNPYGTFNSVAVVR